MLIYKLHTRDCGFILEGGEKMVYNKLHAVRRGFGDRQHDIAEFLGMAVSTYSIKENGIRPFSLDEVQKIVQRYELSPYDIWDVFFNNQCQSK